MIPNLILASIETTKVFGLEFFHAEEFWQLIARFCYNTVWVFIPSYFLYFRKKGDREYFFTFMIVSIIVFQICLLLGNVSLRIGFALGLFAIFGILRYRTNPIPSREMTYLFLVIGMSVKNALANVNISMSELIITDILTVTVAFSIEMYLKKLKYIKKTIVYDRVDLIKPDKYDELLEDLSKRFGTKVFKADIGPVDFIRDQVKLIIYLEKVNGISNYNIQSE